MGRDFLFHTKAQRHEDAGLRPQGRLLLIAAPLRNAQGMTPLRGQHDIFVPPLCEIIFAAAGPKALRIG
ncbi:MAG: hypothetical protein HEQ22_06715 [Sphingopyxis sp.]